MVYRGKTIPDQKRKAVDDWNDDHPKTVCGRELKEAFKSKLK